MTVPYVTPPTAVVGATLPAADWNTKVRDSLESVAKAPRAGVYRATDQSIANGAVVAAIWSNVDYDTDAFWSAAAPERLTVPANLGGLYLVTFSPIFDINATGARFATVAKNAVGFGSPVNSGGSAGWFVQPCVSQLVPLVPGEFVSGLVYHTAGAALLLKATTYKMALTMVRVAV